MLHLIKPRTVVLDAFTVFNNVYETSKIEKMSKSKPSWWKNLPESKFDAQNGIKMSTMRSCNGFNDLYSNSYGVLTACDFYLKKIGNRIESLGATEDQFSVGHQHSPYEMGGALFGEDTAHFKVSLPWFLKSKSDVKWLMTNSAWSHPQASSDIFVPNGITSYKQGHDLNVNMILRSKEPEQVFGFEALKPIAALVPLTENKVVIKHHLVDEKEMTKLKQHVRNLFFTKQYSKELKLAKKCPFHSS